jgi:hypothetical protein
MALVLNGSDSSATTPAVTGSTGGTGTGVYYPANNQVAISTNGTQALLANASQGVQITNTLGVGAATPSTSGAGITFPAAQSASSNANTLDDYEEGTWTASDGSGAGLVLTQSGINYYTKIGRIVYLNFYVTYPATANGSSASINLPFTSNNDAAYYYLFGRTQNLLAGGPVTWQTGGGSAVLTCLTQNNSGGSPITNAQLSGSFILFSGFYIAA